ncbi:hypothetical protein JCM10213v2_000525 [Rhodosporidiobolus nylandii]
MPDTIRLYCRRVDSEAFVDPADPVVKNLFWERELVVQRVRPLARQSVSAAAVAPHGRAHDDLPAEDVESAGLYIVEANRRMRALSKNYAEYVEEKGEQAPHPGFAWTCSTRASSPCQHARLCDAVSVHANSSRKNVVVAETRWRNSLTLLKLAREDEHVAPVTA